MLAILCLILDYLLVKDAQGKGIVYDSKGGYLIKTVNNLALIFTFEIKKIGVILVAHIFSFLTVLIFRGPFKGTTLGASDFMSGPGTSVYYFDTLGQILVFLAPIMYIGILSFLAVKKLKLHPMITASLLLTGAPFYIAFVWILAMSW